MTSTPHIFDGFRKRDGSVVPFRRSKIETAILRASEAVARIDGSAVDATLPARATDMVIQQINDQSNAFHVPPDDHGKRIPRIEDIQDVVEIVLSELDCSSIVTSFAERLESRTRMRSRATSRCLR